MLLRLIIPLTKIILFSVLIGGVVFAYVIYHYSKDLPDYSQLEQYYPPSITRMYSADGKLIEEYAREHRIFVPINNIPKPLIEAFIAAEDKNFYEHSGIDIVSIFRAAINNIHRAINGRGVEGGSTITQQVVKNFLLTSERSIERKIKEAILSYMVTQIFTKDHILELYLNQIYLGKGAYGVAAASLHYFNKSVEDLTLNEAALIASLPKAPSKYNPTKDYTRSFKRKNYVLGRMYDDGYITEEEAREASDQPIKLAVFDKVQTLDADYYAEKVREEVIGMFGEEYFYTAGLTIMTCANAKMQAAAANALRFGIIKYDKKRGYRGALRNIDTTNWQEDLKRIKPSGLRDYHISIVLNIEKDKALIGLGDGTKSKVLLKDTLWAATNLNSMSKLLKIGDVIAVEKFKDHHTLEQIPDVNGGIMVVEHNTGRVLAAEGGYDFRVSKFDRTTQAKRQPGSLIKPFVYLAALEEGAAPNDIFNDAPIELEQGANLPLWIPKNYEENFLGLVTMRMGMEKSRNLVTIRVGQFAGLDKVASVIKRFGINEEPPIVHSMVLGALETTLSKMTMSYGMIANGGRQIESHYIELIKDRKGNVIYKRDYNECAEYDLSSDDEGYPILPKIIQPEGAVIADEASTYQITSFMMGGIQRGTGRGAKHVKHIIAGKTGTTNQSKDGWFMGFTPNIVVGTYIGYDSPRTLGKHMTGASVAIPIFAKFMQDGYDDKPSVDFLVPKSIALAMIDYNTGLLSIGNNSILEAFKVENGYREGVNRNADEMLGRD